MNRTAKCIKLLILLRARGRMSASALAEELETNPRNVREFVRELQEAGYAIESARGVAGGYQLKSGALIPVAPLDERHMEVLRQARDYIRSDPGFAFGSDAAFALDSILALSSGAREESVHYVIGSFSRLSETEKQTVRKIQQAIARQNVIEFSYQKLSQSEPEKRRVNPYELVCSEGRWYLIGYDRARHDYRNFRLSSQRFDDVWICMDQFIRDPGFRLEEHFGRGSIFRFSREYFQIRVRKDREREFLEIDWGDRLEKSEENEEYALYSFYSDHPSSVLRKLTRLGAGAVLKAPLERVREYTDTLRRILSEYE